MSPSNAKVFNKKLITRVVTVFFIVMFMSGYVATVKKQVNEDIGKELYDTSFAIVYKWINFTHNSSLDFSKVNSEELSSLCLKECNALDMMIQDSRIIKPEYLNSSLMNVSKGVFIGSGQEYILAGYKMSSFYVNANKTKAGVLFEDVDDSLLAYVESHYDDGVFKDEKAGLSGAIRYSKVGEGKVSMGIFFDINDVINMQRNI